MKSATMKNTFKTVLFLLLTWGVFGVDADEVKTVMEGESVTLYPVLDKIQIFNQIKWRFGHDGSVMAETDGKNISYPHLPEIFKGRLLLYQNGSLTIKNMRINDTGLYKVKIDYNNGNSDMKFSVTVYEAFNITLGKVEIKNESVMVGDMIILQPNVKLKPGDKLIVWRFGNSGKFIAKCEIGAKNQTLCEDTDDGFRNRLKLDHTGPLTITNSKATDSGLYAVNISSSNNQTSYNIFIVTVSGAVARSVVVVVVVVLLLLLLLLLVYAVGVSGVFYYRHKISKLERPNHAINSTDRYVSQYSLITEDLEDNIKDSHEELQLDGKEWLEDSAKSSHMCLEEHEENKVESQDRALKECIDFRKREEWKSTFLGRKWKITQVESQGEFPSDYPTADSCQRV